MTKEPNLRLATEDILAQWEPFESTPPPQHKIPWVSTGCPPDSAWLTDEVDDDQRHCSYGFLTRALENCDIIRKKNVEPKGAYVLLPRGIALVQRFQSMVRNLFRDAGLYEFEFPDIAPIRHFGPLEDICPAASNLLYGTDSRRRAFRTPTHGGGSHLPILVSNDSDGR